MVWKGIKVAAGFYTPMCEQRQMHVDKVKFDQVNNADMRGGNHP